MTAPASPGKGIRFQVQAPIAVFPDHDAARGPPGDSAQCSLPNSRKIRRGAYSYAIEHWVFSPVLLEDMPKRMRRRMLRNVSRIEVDAAYAAEIPLRTLPVRIARLGRRLVNLRANIPWISRHS